MWDVFISHATEDKEHVARPLAAALTNAGLSVWYDEFTLTLGDSLSRSIDRGLADTRYGIVILSPAFFAKAWPQRELDGLTTREVSTGKVILPVWHHVNRAQVERFSPILADRVAVSTDKGLEPVVQEIQRAIKKTPAETRSIVAPRRMSWRVIAPVVGLSTALVLGVLGYQRVTALTPEKARASLAQLSLPYTPDAFVMSAERGDVQGVTLFLAAGMDPNAVPDSRTLSGTALMHAAAKGHVPAMRALLGAHADVNKSVFEGRALDWAAGAREERLEAVRLLLDNGADAESINSAFGTAASAGHRAILGLLLTRGADTRKVGPAALLAAARHGQSETVSFLLDLGIDVNTRDERGRTALHIAHEAGSGSPTKVVQVLLDRAADPDARDQDGCTPLWWAAGIGQYEMATMLVAKGADVNARDNAGYTVLQRAKYNSDKQMIRLLLDHGAG
jgi:ankyrin repeat protein